ncbi:hypothetical protein EDD85DRAFT_332180 [Armillaria nabsnona]|nr:hypothetical protein EDD85DRAFT_332180 [Armillaria nabsnona]
MRVRKESRVRYRIISAGIQIASSSCSDDITLILFRQRSYGPTKAYASVTHVQLSSYQADHFYIVDSSRVRISSSLRIERRWLARDRLVDITHYLSHAVDFSETRCLRITRQHVFCSTVSLGHLQHVSKSRLKIATAEQHAQAVNLSILLPYSVLYFCRQSRNDTRFNLDVRTGTLLASGGRTSW